jgi:Sugar kinases, ribokinase family
MASSIVVGGVLALDNLKTPKRSEKKIGGGAGIYSSISSSIFADTAFVAVIGNDFPDRILDKIKTHGIDIESVKELIYPTFHWCG